MFSIYKYSTGLFIKDEVTEQDILIAKRKLRMKNKLISNKSFVVYSNDKDVLNFKKVKQLDLNNYILPFEIKKENKIKTITIIEHSINGTKKDYVCFLTTEE